MPNGAVWMFGLSLADFREVAERHAEAIRVGWTLDLPTEVPNTPCGEYGDRGSPSLLCGGCRAAGATSGGVSS